MSILLEARSLTKTYGRLVALRNVSFTIEEGETVGLVGPNGAGKTTLIGVLSGAIKATTGSVIFLGRSILGLRADQAGALGIVRTFQMVQPFSQLTVKECVMLGVLFGASEGRSTEVAQARLRATEFLHLVGLEEKQNTPCELLNVPERKCLEIARALAARPKLLLLDEVMAGLSGTEIAQMLGLLRDVRDRGVTIIVIEHMLHAIRGLARRAIVLHHGEKIADGPVEGVLADDSVVKYYVGATSPPQKSG
jgi:branched-chain amino acid transport system ATP-binding protein